MTVIAEIGSNYFQCSIEQVHMIRTHLHMPQDYPRSDGSDAGDEKRNRDLNRRLPPFFLLVAGRQLVLALVFSAIIARAASAWF